MGISDRLKDKYAARIDELVAAGTAMPIKQHSRQTSFNVLPGKSTYRHYDLASWPEFVEWRTSCIAVLDQVVPKDSLLRKSVDALHCLENKPSEVTFTVAFLRSVKAELAAGFLDSLTLQIKAEVLSDYLEQAIAILAGSRNEPNHIAAAVVAGASLERSLRSLCSDLSPPEPTTTEKGVPLGLNALIDALKKRQVYNELRAKLLRAWAAIRNSAAHGEFEAFSRQQVEGMVAGIETFLAEHMK
jgi:hypothetical protein